MNYKVLFVFFILSINIIYSEDLKIGIFVLRKPSLVKETKSQAIRFFLKDNHIKKMYEVIDKGKNIESIPQVREIMQIADQGVDVIVTLRWPDFKSANPKRYDRVPQGADRKNSLEMLKRLLDDLGPYFTIISLQNEVGGLGPGTYSQQDMTPDHEKKIPAFEWLKSVANVIKKAQSENPKLKHLKIASPTPIILKQLALGSVYEIPQINKNFTEELFHFSNKHCNYIDLHLNHNTIEEMKQMIAYARKRTSLPFISTEWSETHNVIKWLKEPVDKEFRRKLMEEYNISIPINMKNEQILKYTSQKPVSEYIWDEWIKTSWMDENYMLQSYDVMRKNNFKYILWAQGFQHGGLAPWMPRSIYPNITVQKSVRRKYPRSNFLFQKFQQLLKYAEETNKKMKK